MQLREGVCVCVWDVVGILGGFGHVTSCGLISAHSAQMACDYARLSRDYSAAAQLERETRRVKINIALLVFGFFQSLAHDEKRGKKAACGVREVERGRR